MRLLQPEGQRTVRTMVTMMVVQRELEPLEILPHYLLLRQVIVLLMMLLVRLLLPYITPVVSMCYMAANAGINLKITIDNATLVL
jgi:hypothetical protein